MKCFIFYLLKMQEYPPFCYFNRNPQTHKQIKHAILVMHFQFHVANCTSSHIKIHQYNTEIVQYKYIAHQEVITSTFDTQL